MPRLEKLYEFAVVLEVSSVSNTHSNSKFHSDVEFEGMVCLFNLMKG